MRLIFAVISSGTLTPVNVAGICLANSDAQIEIQGGITMACDPKSLAGEVVESFQSLLDSETREAVGEHNFHALHGMVREAIAEQSEVILDQLEQTLKQIRSERVERRPLEL